jgi:hypothetical protein
MIDPNKVRVIAQWIDVLARTVAKRREEGWTEEKDKAMKATYVDFLYADFQSSAATFTQASVRDIARQNEFFPPYKLLHRQLTAWWELNKPRSAALEGPAGAADLSEMDRLSIKLWTEMALAGGSREKLTIRLDVLRSFADGAFQWLVTNDLTAASIARQHHWVREIDGDITGADVRKALDVLPDHPMQAFLCGVYRRMLAERAPQFLPMLDDFAAPLGLLAAGGPTPEQLVGDAPPPAFKPKPIAPDVLAEARKAAGIHLPAVNLEETPA